MENLNQFATQIKDGVDKLNQKYEALNHLKSTVLEECEKLSKRIQEPMQGTIVYKKVCCHKSACGTCGGKRNEHGPYPHLQWEEPKTKKTKTRYISRKNLTYFEEQLALNTKLKKRQRLLVLIQTRQQRILTTFLGVIERVNGKEVNQDVQPNA